MELIPMLSDEDLKQIEELENYEKEFKIYNAIYHKK